MKRIFLAAFVLSLAPVAALANTNPPASPNHTQTVHDRTPRPHDRSPRPHQQPA